MPGILEKNYLSHAEQTNPAPHGEGQVAWECPANIAIIKYWGKKLLQLPLNPSLSFTLSKSKTRLSLAYAVDPGYSFDLDFRFDGKAFPEFRQSIHAYLQRVLDFFPFLKHAHLTISTSNSFPHSAGVASSASSFGALALALCSIEQKIHGTENIDTGFFRKASFMARLGSGSACRSVYGGAVLWGCTQRCAGSSDETAIPVSTPIHPEFNNFRNTILVVNSKAKPVSSSAGHELMDIHPYAEARIIQANTNLGLILDILNAGDLIGFIDILEHEALSLHALMMSSNPGYILLHPNTIVIIDTIRSYRRDTGLPVGFTLDAGPNVHVLYPAAIEGSIRLFIEEHLKKYCENGIVIHDQVGEGPEWFEV